MHDAQCTCNLKRYVVAANPLYYCIWGYLVERWPNKCKKQCRLSVWKQNRNNTKT